jgi:hypothetical protein
VSTTILSGIFPWMLRRNSRSQLKPTRKNRTLGGSDARWYRVKVDMDRLRAHLAPGSAGKADERVVRKWLRQSGFERRGDWWIVREAGLGQLAPSELAASEPMDD